MVKLYAGHLADKETLRQEIELHRETHQRMLNTFLALEEEYLSSSKQEQEAIALPYLTLRRGILGEQAWLAWSKEVLDFLA